MNFIFPALFLISGTALCILSPEEFLPSLLLGGQKAALLTGGLLASYALWLGFAEVMKASNLTSGLSRALTPALKKLFSAEKEETLAPLSLNVAANLLGLGSLATPFGIRAAKASENEKNAAFVQSMLFVLSATSLQILPTTAMSLLSLHGGTEPQSIFLPSFLTSALSTLIGVLLTFLFVKRKK